MMENSKGRACKYCRKSDCKLSSCSTCRSAHYCGKECQQLDWKSHKCVCEAVKRMHIQVNILVDEHSPLDLRVGVVGSGCFDADEAFAAACKRPDFSSCIVRLIQQDVDSFEAAVESMDCELLLWSHHILPALFRKINVAERHSRSFNDVNSERVLQFLNMHPEIWPMILSVLSIVVRAATRYPQSPILLDLARDIARVVDHILLQRELGMFILSHAMESTTATYKELSVLIKDEGNKGLAGIARRVPHHTQEGFSALEGLLFSHMACMDHWEKQFSATVNSADGRFIENCGLLAGPKSGYYKRMYKLAVSMSQRQMRAKNT